MATILLALAIGLVAAVIVAWMAGALYFDVGEGRRIGWLWVAGWLAGVATAAYFSPSLWITGLILIAVLGFFLRWRRSLQPTHDRDWDPNSAQLAQIDVAGDQITVHNVRCSEYRSADDLDARFETRIFWLSRLLAVDVLIPCWSSEITGRPILVFDFGDSGRLCISTEIRFRVGQRYSFWRTLYRQYELMYEVCDERDAMLRRTHQTPDQDLHLYRLLGSRLEMREWFFDCATQINQLLEQPRWFHGLTANSNSLIKPSRKRWRWDISLILNHRVDERLYDRGRLDQTVPYRELKRLSRVNDLAHRAPADGFGDFIRQTLPGYQFEANKNLSAEAIAVSELPWHLDDLVQLDTTADEFLEPIVGPLEIELEPAYSHD